MILRDPREAPFASAEDLRALRDKYATLAEMRRSDARGEPHRPDAFYRALAARFPGALKELDRLPLEEIDRRVSGLARALDGGAVEPWMTAITAYHAKLRELLAAKRRGEPVCGGERCSIVALATARAAEASGLGAPEVRTLLALKQRG